MSRIIFHIDVNSAYLSWSAVDRLEHGETLDIRTVPAIIGGDSATRPIRLSPVNRLPTLCVNVLPLCWFHRIMPCTTRKVMHLWNFYTHIRMILNSFP